MRTYAKSCVRRKSFYSKSELQMLMLSLIMISGGHICVPKQYTNMASPYKVYNGAWNVSANNSETVGHIDLRLGKIVYISVCCNTSFSWLFPLDGFQFIFLCRIYCVTVKRDRLKGLCNLGLKFSIPGFFWVRKFGKYFFGYLDLSKNFWGVLKRIDSAVAA